MGPHLKTTWLTSLAVCAGTVSCGKSACGSLRSLSALGGRGWDCVESGWTPRLKFHSRKVPVLLLKVSVGRTLPRVIIRAWPKLRCRILLLWRATCYQVPGV